MRQQGGGQHVARGNTPAACVARCPRSDNVAPDGNLVLYGPGGAVWGSTTAGYSAGLTAMQSDGNLVVYDAGLIPRWASNTSGHSGAYLVIEDSSGDTHLERPQSS